MAPAHPHDHAPDDHHGDHGHDHEHHDHGSAEQMAAWRDTDPSLWFTEAFWDDRYRERPIWSGNANQRLVETATELAPGRALDVGCGEGGDAIWLAARGWQVTATDVSPVALERAREAARAAGVADAITFEHSDGRSDWAPPAGAHDLVTVSFVQFPRAELTGFHRKLAAAVAPGGTLLITAHHADSHGGGETPFSAELFATAAEMAAGLDLGPDWQVSATDPTREAVVPPGPGGRPTTVRDAVLRAVRAPV
ncbi:class I SAM-dependent methyltransferase [Klenkia brasiliensis]|uniref:Methyltransferase domain-containing protein n=1 Tax=Klenkia brasiliensis TaxID=333142 RepID=A0A1G7V942_9ACTN|nr:class I SAM-dependent methyltransferase [Klenkia brasiliensis]SDG56283.1 Methyltransferase domain-containing protein [Klenkia brasiliensis]